MNSRLPRGYPLQAPLEGGEKTPLPSEIWNPIYHVINPPRPCSRPLTTKTGSGTLVNVPLSTQPAQQRTTENQPTPKGNRLRNLPALAAYLLIDLIEAALIAFVLALVTTLAHNAYQAIPALPFGLVFAVTALILVLLTLAGVQHGPYSRNSGNGPTV